MVGVADGADVALRLVVDRDGLAQEAELSLEADGTSAVIGFEQDAEVDDEPLSAILRGSEGEAVVQQRDDGEIAVRLTLYASAEQPR